MLHAVRRSLSCGKRVESPRTSESETFLFLKVLVFSSHTVRHTLEACASLGLAVYSYRRAGDDQDLSDSVTLRCTGGLIRSGGLERWCMALGLKAYIILTPLVALLRSLCQDFRINATWTTRRDMIVPIF